MDTKDSILDVLDELTEQGILSPASAGGERYIIMRQDSIQRAFPLYGKGFELALKQLLLRKYQIKVHRQQYLEIVEYLEILAYGNTLDHALAKRIYNENNNIIVYDLNQDTSTAVWIEDGCCEIVQLEECIFKRTDNYKNQILPDLEASPEELLPLINKHFNLKSREEVELMALYLVSCLWGLELNHPLLVLSGEKGSSKSNTLKKLERIIDPKQSELCGMPKGADGLELRLANSYYVTLDNLSYIRQSTSDTLARSVTGGCITKRKMYSDCQEIILNIKAVVALNGIDVVVKSSDLLERSILIELKKLKPDQIKTEAELQAEFETDLPRILGACFNTLAVALADKSAPAVKERIRMADFNEACLKIGKAIGLTEEHTNLLLKKNQSRVNNQAMDDDMTALCIVELLEIENPYVNAMHGLLYDLKVVAEEEGIDVMCLPKSPSSLSRHLNNIASNLEQEYGITYRKRNIGPHKQIQLQRKTFGKK